MKGISGALQRVADRIYELAPKAPVSSAVPKAVAQPQTYFTPYGTETISAAVREAKAGADLTNVAIFQYRPGLEAHRLVEELSARGITPHVLNIDGLKQASDGAFTYYGREMPKLDGAIMYDGAMGPANGPEMLRKLEQAGTFVAQRGDGLELSRHKIASAEVLPNQPRSMELRTDADSARAGKQLFRSWPRQPRGLVLKADVGTHGDDVIKVTKRSRIAEAARQLRQGNVRVLAQELVNARGRDLRILVGRDEVGGELEVFTALQRTNRKRGEFRANVALGGEPHRVRVNDRQRALAIKAVEDLGLDFGGVDIFQNQTIRGWLWSKITGTPPKPLTIEVNSGPDSPEWITGDDVYGRMAKFVASGAAQAKEGRALARSAA